MTNIILLYYDDIYRSASYVTTDVTRRKCDDTLEKQWYRFDSPAGTEMPTFPPKTVGACGTTFAIWLTGKVIYFSYYRNLATM